MLQENPLLERAEGRGRRAPPELPLAGAGTATGDAPSGTTRATRRRRRRRQQTRSRERRATTCRTCTDFDDYGGGGDGDWGGGSAIDDDDDFSPQQIATSSLRDHLMRQLALLNLPLRDRQIVAALIDALDDDGYLPTSLEEIAELLPATSSRSSREELTIALKLPAELRAGRRRRARSRRMPGAAAEDAAARTRRSRAMRCKIVDGHLPLLASARLHAS